MMSTRQILSAIVLAEITKSAPIRLDRLVQKVARQHGFHRAGHEIQDRVTVSIPRACKRTTDSAGVFVWPERMDPSSCSQFRRPSPGQAIDPAEIPIEELAALARDCLACHADVEATLLAMRDACGLTKLREGSTSAVPQRD